MRDAGWLWDLKEEDDGWLARHGLRLIHRVPRLGVSAPRMFGVGNHRNLLSLTEGLTWRWFGAFFATREEAEDHALKYLLVEAGR